MIGNCLYSTPTISVVHSTNIYRAPIISQMAQWGKKSTCSAGDTEFDPWAGNPLEEGIAIHSNILTWRIPWKRSLVGFGP